jgi:membrane fusion protein, multidrug efflux system
MQNRFKISILATALVAVGAMMSGCGKQAATAAAPPMGPPEVGVVAMQPQQVPLNTELPGRTSAYLVAEVRPQVGGIIKKRLFTEGSDVRAGQLLYELDPGTFQAAYNSAKAALGKAEAALVPAKLKADRYKQLVGVNAVSKQDYDDAAAAVRTAEAEVEAARANVESARINLAYTRVTAPISGRIGRSAVTTGSLVTANQAAPLATIQNLDTVYVDLTQSNADLLKLKQSFATGKVRAAGVSATRVKLILENGMPYPLEGSLKFSEVTVDPSTGSVTLRSVFPNPKQTLLPGMYVRAIIEQGVAQNGLLVPQRGVSRDTAGNATALVVGADSKVEQRILKVSRTIGENWLVDSGLKPGDRVIVEGLQKAKPGVPVKAVAFTGDSVQPPAAGMPAAPAAAPAAQPAAPAAKPAAPAAKQAAAAHPAVAKK